MADWNTLRSSGEFTTCGRSSDSHGSVGGWRIIPLNSRIRGVGRGDGRVRYHDYDAERMSIRESYSTRFNMGALRRDGFQASRGRDQTRHYDGAPKRRLEDAPRAGMDSIPNHTFG